MPRPLDGHFSAMGKDSLKRLDPAQVKEPERQGIRWGLVLVVVLLVGGVGAGWCAVRAGYLPSFLPSDLGPGVSGQQESVSERLASDLDDPFGDHALAAPATTSGDGVLPEVPAPAEIHLAAPGQPAADADPAARQRCNERMAEARRGIAHLTKELIPHVADEATISRQLADADKVQWPKPSGHYTYEGWLKKQWADAKAQGKGQLAFDLETRIGEYHSLRRSSETRLDHERDVIASLKQRIAVEEERTRQAEADLAALP